MTGSGRRRVAVVTGGGGGIGAAIAEELGRRGTFVVTVDPLVTVDGSESLPAPEETTAGRIMAAGGDARSSSVSVTDADGMAALLTDLAAEFGGLDAVVNVAGITRPTSFASGSESDWLDVLSVHLDGYRNVVEAALPIMASNGHGRILGVTSGSGWRSADAGAYGCAKRAVAALTWQLGSHCPPGVTVNALSPIAATRMVAAALARAQASTTGRTGGSGGLSLSAMPQPGELGPLGAHLVGDGFGWCSGRVIFAAGSELAVIDEPRLLEAVRTDDPPSASVLDTVVSHALAPAEANQSTTGATNARFPGLFDSEPAGAVAPPRTSLRCLVVSDPPRAEALRVALEGRGVACTVVDVARVTPDFEGAARALDAAVDPDGPPDAVVVTPVGGRVTAHSIDWQRVLAEHRNIVDAIRTDAAWARAVADMAGATGRRMRLVTLTDASTSGGNSRGQSAAQLARAARGATADAVSAYAVAVEAPWSVAGRAAAELTASLVAVTDPPSLSGAELVVGPGWLGLRSHPRPVGSVTFGGPAVPDWIDSTLRGMVGHRGGNGS